MGARRARRSTRRAVASASAGWLAMGGAGRRRRRLALGAFLAGRALRATPDETKVAETSKALPPDARDRVLQAALADHLDSSQRLLLEVANGADVARGRARVGREPSERQPSLPPRRRARRTAPRRRGARGARARADAARRRSRILRSPPRAGADRGRAICSSRSASPATTSRSSHEPSFERARRPRLSSRCGARRARRSPTPTAAATRTAKGSAPSSSEDWDDASRIFGKLASGSSDETDAALYWKAYADWKRKLKKESLEGVRQLWPTYPKSAWADDAKALELEIRGGERREGRVASDDEELKLYALDGLMQVDPEKAVPVLEKLLAGDSSPRVKERALFVLSQSDSPRAREILVRTAKTGPADGAAPRGGQDARHRGRRRRTSPRSRDRAGHGGAAEVRDAVIEAYLIADRPDELLEHRQVRSRPAHPRQGDRRARRHRRAPRAAAALEHGEGPGAPREAPRVVRHRRRRRHAGEGGAGEPGPAAPPEGDRRARHLGRPRGAQGASPAVRRVRRSRRQAQGPRGLHDPGRREDADRAVPRREGPGA